MLLGGVAVKSWFRTALVLAISLVGVTGCRSSIGYTSTGRVYRSNDHILVNYYLTGIPFGTPVEPEPVVYSNVYVYGQPPAPGPNRENSPATTDLPPFDPHAARAALNEIDVTACQETGAPHGFGHAKVVFNPDGRISKVVVDEPSGLSQQAAKCIGDRLGTATVPPFKGGFIAMGTTFHVD